MTGNRLTQVIQRLRRAVGGPADGPGDPELLRRYAVAREEQAFTLLVERHGPMVRGVCRRVLGQDADADDAFQATFLVLARKAGSGFWRESVAGWLYQVAYRTACKARVQIARRQRHEQAADQRAEIGTFSPEMRELRQILDEELSRLPEKFRLPVLLCCLQDQTTDEAARQLGWSFTTVKGRLQRGREMLRKRLQKRGVALSAGVLGTLLAESSAGAVPVGLVTVTVQAAVSGTIAPAVAALVKGVCQTMFWGKMKIAALVLVGMTVLGIGGGIEVSRMGTAGAAALAVPIPDDPPTKTKPPEGPMASKPAIKDGLEVVVKPTQAVFPAGQVPALEVSFTNRGIKNFHLYSVNYVADMDCPWLCEDIKTRQTWYKGGAKRDASPSPRTLTLGPSKSDVQNAYLHGPFHLGKPGELRKATPKPLKNLPPGKYRVTAQFRFMEGPQNRNKNWWTGEITTNPVEVVIGEAKGKEVGLAVPLPQDKATKPKEGPLASKPAVKDGLEVVVKPAQAVFPANQPPLLDFTFTNRGSEALELVNADIAVRKWTCVDATTGRVWEGAALNLKNARRKQPIVYALNVGESRTAQIRLGGPFQWAGATKGTPPPRPELPPGKYRVTALLQLVGTQKGQAPLNWSSQITTNPVEVVIAEKPGR